METALPPCAPSVAAMQPVASAFHVEDVIPADVLAAIDGQYEPARSGPIGRLLPKLVDLWRFDAGRLLHDESLVGRVAKKHLAKEIGYRRRIRHRVPATEARQVVGDDEFRIDGLIAELAANGRENFVVSSASDRGLVGAPAYPGSSPPNPFTWIPVIAGHSQGNGVVWEVGPGWVSSAAEVARRMHRRVLLVQPPAAGGNLQLRFDPIYGQEEHHLDDKAEHRLDDGQVDLVLDPLPLGDEGDDQSEQDSDGDKPDLVLVPLPVPMDAWSITDCVRAWKAGLGLWARPSDKDLEVEHAEFSCDLGSYMQAAVSRLGSLGQVVAAGAKMAVTAPMVRGLPPAVEKAIKQSFPTWQLVERRYAFEQDGKIHIGNGTPLVGDAITVWEGGR